MEPTLKPNYFIITGAPGTGKTSVLQELAQRGYTVAPEPAREVLEHQLKTDGPALPSKNPMLFVQTMLAKAIEQFRALEPHNELVFFDRGIPDLIAYAIRFKISPSAFETASLNYLYNRTVFVCAPWKDIFINDEVRKLTFEMSQQIHDLHLETYRKLGFTIIEVPFESPARRADFIEAKAQTVFTHQG